MRGFRAAFPMWVLVLATVLCHAGMAAEDKGVAKKPAAFAVTVTGTGKPMILIPGLGCGGDVWDGTVAHFKDRYQCHVVTLAGFAGQPSIGSPMLPQVRDGLIAYMAEKKLDHPIIVGHSLGGFMAFWVAETASEKVGPVIAVDGVPFFPALMNAKATAESARPFAEQMRSMNEGLSPEQFAENWRGFLASMITNPKDLDMVATSGVKSDPKAVGQAGYELMSTDLRADVKAIKAPVLLIGATASIPDPNARKAAQANYESQIASIPTHKLIFATKAKHFIQLDEPDFFYKEVESFLKGTDTKKGK
jgi:N-formylmaleamate deformylase